MTSDIMASYRRLVHLGTCCLIMGAVSACADNPDPVGSAGGAGGGSGSFTGGGGGTSGMTGTAGTGGKTSAGGAAGSGGQAGTGGVMDSGGRGGADAGGAGTGTAGTAGAGGSGGYPLDNPPVPSAGCGKPATITTSTSYRTITSSGEPRQYMITLPANYDMDKPHRFIYASHGQGGEGADITSEKYYSIQNIAEAANSTIFVSASGLGGIWGLKDVPLFDDILELVKQSACVDESRVFVLGFSFGGMYSYSLSMTRQDSIRAGIGMSPANYNIQIPTKTHEPIAWMQSTGMDDQITPWVNDEARMRGAKFIAIEHATDNGCMVPVDIPIWESGDMVCHDFVGCKPGYPVKACTFDGGHGLPGGFSGAADWMWEFISQF
jgi:poly(3-hydroxybutyrate) depolymerase